MKTGSQTQSHTVSLVHRKTLWRKPSVSAVQFPQRVPLSPKVAGGGNERKLDNKRFQRVTTPCHSNLPTAATGTTRTMTAATYEVIEPHRIVKKTKKRLYVDDDEYDRRPSSGEWWDYDRPTFVLDRREFETSGKAERSRRVWWWHDSYYADPALSRPLVKKPGGFFCARSAVNQEFF